ncbi:uncharacterized protein METZ01_LOCUS495466, partial [marine metagenome]
MENKFKQDRKNPNKKSDNSDQQRFQWKQAGKTSLIWI